MELLDLAVEKDRLSTIDNYPNFSEKPSEDDEDEMEDGNDVDVPQIPSLQKLVAQATPSETGLYPHELRMLSCAPDCSVNKQTFSKSWLYEDGVTNPRAILDSLYERGYIAVDGVEKTIKKLKVAELKKELAEIGAKKSGKKEELISRILELEDVKTLEEKYPDRYFVLTEKGKQELNNNEYIRHVASDISIWDMNRQLNKKGSKHLSYQEVIWENFQKKLNKYFNKAQYGLYCCTLQEMHEYFMQEKQYDKAFTYLCGVIYSDLSGLTNGDRGCQSNDVWEHWEFLWSMLNRTFPYGDCFGVISPGIIQYLKRMKRILELDDNSLKNAILNEFQKFSLPYHLFTSEECVEITIGELNGKIDDVKKIYQVAEKRVQIEEKKAKEELERRK